ncbi:MAG: type I restriction-modification enzyme R subunit C-terminal domain-containing protein [Ferruginibacter sp.]
MRHGIKVAGGDRLGKTIFFARSHKHALFIKERFDKQYPHYGGHFCQVIDNYQEYAYDILNRFSEKESNPHIAISVDMLDTGIDVPEVVNLVFIKTIKSKTKFLQMIGRGTRLCKNLFGPDDDKTHFLIFDFLENFEFFGNKPKGDDSNQGKSLSQRLFAQRLKLVNVLQKQEEEDLCNYAKELQQYLFKQVTSLEDHSFLVRQHWREVEKYKDPLQWNALNELDTKELVDHIATLVIEADEDEMAKRFDLICYNMQVDLMLKGSINNSQKEEIQTLAGKLTKKASIPAVAAKLFVLQDIQKSIFWKDISILKAEKLRKDMRNLMKFIDKEDVRIVYASFNDEYFGDVKEYTMSLATNDLEAYRKKVAHYIQSHQNHITIHKLKMNIPITTSELRVVDEMLFEQGEIGNKEQFEKVYGIQPLGKFIRSIVGLDVTAAKEVFVKFINAPALNAQQIRFVDTIIQYLTVNGTIEASALFAAPFTDISTNGLTDVFDNTQSAEIVSMVERVNRNALVAG